MENISNIVDFNNKDIQNSVVKIWELVKNTVEKLEEFKVKNDELVSTNAYLGHNLAERDVQLRIANDRMLNLEIDFEDIKSRNYNFAEEINNLKAKLEIINEYENLKSEHENLHQKYALLKEKASFIITLSQELTEEKQKSSNLESKIIDQRREIEELIRIKDNLEFAQKDIARKNILIHSTAQDIETLSSSLALAESEVFKLKNLENQLRSISEENKKLKGIIQDDIYTKDTEINKIKESLRDLELENSTQKNTISNLREIVIQKDLLIDEQTNRIYQYENESKEYIIQVTGLESEMSMKVHQISELKESIMALSNQVNEMKEYRELHFYKEKQLDESKIEIKKLNALINALEIQILNNNEQSNAINSDLKLYGYEREELKNNIDLIAKKLEEKDIENDALIKSNKELQTLIEIEKVNSKDLKEYSEVLENDNLSLKNQSTKLDSQIGLFTDEIGKLNLLVIESNKKYEALKLDNDNLNFKLLEGEEKANELISLNDSLNLQVAEIESKLNEFSDSKSELNIKLLESVEQVSLLLHENDGLTKKLSEFDSIFSELDELKNNLADSELMNSLITEDIDNYKSKLAEFVSVNQDLQKNLIELQQLNDEILFANKQLKEENRELARKATEYSLTGSLFDNEIQNHKDQMISMFAKEKEYSNKIENLERELRFEIENKNSLASQIIALENEIDRHSVDLAKIDSFNSEIFDLKNSLLMNESKSEDNLQKIEEFKSIIAKLSENLISKENDYNIMQENLNNLNGQYDSLRLEYEQTKLSNLQVGIRNEKIIELEEKINSLTNDLMLSEIKSADLETKSRDLEALIKTRHDQINILDIQLNDNLKAKNLETLIKKELFNKVEIYIEKIDSIIEKM